MLAECFQPSLTRLLCVQLHAVICSIRNKVESALACSNLIHCRAGPCR